jgi:hypothetical protein
VREIAQIPCFLGPRQVWHILAGIRSSVQVHPGRKNIRRKITPVRERKPGSGGQGDFALWCTERGYTEVKVGRTVEIDGVFFRPDDNKTSSPGLSSSSP